MSWSTLGDVTPLLLLMLVGIAVRSTGLIDGRGGIVLTRLAYYVTIPATIYLAISRATMTPSMLLLWALGFGIPAAMAGLLYLTTRRLADQPELRGVLLVASVVLVVFGYPFFQLYYGEEGLARIAMLDAGNATYAGTVALWLAQRFGHKDGGEGVTLRGVLSSPLLLAVLAGVVSSLVGLRAGGILEDFLTRLSAANSPVVMIAVGLYIHPRANHGPLITQYVLIRMLGGALVGLALALLLGLRGLDAITVSSGSALPAGTTALIYANKEGLDAEFAASIISSTVLVGSFMAFALPQLLGIWLL